MATTRLAAAAWLAIGLAALPAAAQEETPAPAVKEALDLSTGFKRVVEQVRPSVVTIRSTRVREVTVRRFGPALPPGFEDFFEDDFFGRFFEDRSAPDGEDVRRFEQTGFGSGVIVREDGYILTNNHVIAGADEVIVTDSDGREHTAEVVGTDAQTDLAVLKIEATGLDPAELGDSDAVEVGDWVVAVGNPFNLSYTVTAGIISAVGRANVGIADYEDFIQTDAAINPGNSGGPLVNMRGEVIGINTAIASRTGAYMGVGFAIPTNMARQVMESIIETGRVERGWLGVVIQNLDERLARSFGFSGTDGVVISQVSPDSPAAEAGLREGDIITRFGEREVENITELRNAVAATAPGSKVPVRYFREGREQTTTVEVGEQEAPVAAGPGREPAPAARNLGMRLQNLTPERARQLGLESPEGVLVVEVEPGSPASRATILPGDVIVRVQDEPVANIAAFRKRLAELDLSEGVRLVVITRGQQRFVVLQQD